MKNNINTVFQILAELKLILNRRQKKELVEVFVVIMFVTGLELLGVSAIIPFIQSMMSPEEIMEDKKISWLFSLFNVHSTTGVILLTGLVLIIVYLVKNAVLIYFAFVQARFSSRIQADLSVKMLNSYMNKPYTFFLNSNTAEILRGCQSDIHSTYFIISKIMQIVAEILALVAIGTFIIITDFGIAISTIALMMIVLVGILYVFKPIVKKSGEKDLKIKTQKNKIILQVVSGIKDIFVMNRKKMFIDQFKEITEAEYKVQKVYSALGDCPDRIVEGVCVSGIVGILCVKSILFPGNIADFIPQMASFALAAFRILPSIGKITSRINDIIYYRPGLENVYTIMVAAKDENDESSASCECVYTKAEFIETLVVKNIYLKYEKQKDFVLKDASIYLNKGESIAFIGTSGAGKTSLADVILGLLRPQKGSVEVDGIDIFSVPEYWANIVGFVPQSVYLLDDTIRNNILFGTSNENDLLIWEALDRAQIGSYVRTLPNGLDTIVGERGVKFSGGQRQRIAIARALYNRPQILVLDEATAALDNETEKAVMESIEALQGTITMIIVAHRLSTIKKADRIYEIKDGRAIERDKKEIIY